MSIWTIVASFGKELLIGKVRSDHQQQVAVHHGVIAGGKSQQAGHPHVERVVVLDELLSAHRMHNRGFQFARKLDQLRMRPRAARSAKNRDLLRPVENLRQTRDFVIGGTNGWSRRRKMQARLLLDGVAQGDVSRDGDHRNATPRKCGLHRNLQNARHLLGLRNQFAVMAALREEMFRMGFLKISAADFLLGICAAIASTGTRLRWQS